MDELDQDSPANNESIPLKRPRSAWIIFTAENRKRIREEQPNLSFQEIAQALSTNYKNLDEEQKRKYDDLASKEKEYFISHENTCGSAPQISESDLTIRNSIFLPLVCVKCQVSD